MKKKCIICNKDFIGTNAAITCSSECATIRKKETDKIKVSNKNIKCHTCGGYFIGNNNNKYCSKECKSKKIIENKKEYNHVCEQCNNEYTNKLSNSKYCSYECRCKSYKKPTYNKMCEQCNNEYVTNTKNSRFCSISCVADYNRKYPLIKCEYCSNHFVNSDVRKKRKFCSFNCYLSAIGVSKNNTKRYYNNTHIVRAKKYNVKYEYIDIENIFNSDKWICKICGSTVDKFKPYPHPLSASLDHIIPLSKGGTHTIDNVQLSHLKCNLQKSNNI